LATNRSLIPAFTQKVAENKQQLLNDLVKFVKSETITPEQLDTALRCLSALGQNPELRLIFYRLKIIEELNERLYKCTIQ
jgi:hypothetical protein